MSSDITLTQPWESATSEGTWADVPAHAWHACVSQITVVIDHILVWK